MQTNYFGIDGNGFSYETDGYDKIYTNFPTSIYCDGEDILGEDDDPEDGTDYLDIEVYEMPSYQIEISPQNPKIPLTLSPSQFEIKLSKMSESIQPAYYDHVRVTVEYDRKYMRCVNSEAIIYSIPDYLTNVTVSVLTNSFSESSITEDIIIEGYCDPTDFEGNIAVIELLPLKIDENLELDFTGWLIDQPTAVDRFGIADLLGFPDDETDGLPEAFFDITNVPGLYLELENSEEFYISGIESGNKLVLKNESDDHIGVDSLVFEMLYNTNLLSMIAPEFIPFTNTVYSAGTNVTISFSVLDNLVLPNESLSNEYSYFWTNSKFRLTIDFDSPIIITQEATEIGSFNFLPKVPGTLGFLGGECRIINNASDINDPEKQLTAWPSTFSVLEQDEVGNQLFVSLISDDKNPEFVYPGTYVDLNIFGYCQRPVSNASYSLCWTYDSTALSFESGSPFVTNLEIIVDSDETTSVIYVHSDDYTSISNTNLLGNITFKALLPETVFLEPVTFDMSDSHFCRFEEDGEDILGTASEEDDGVTGEVIDIDSVDELTITFNPTAALYAGLQANSYFEIENPEEVLWDRCSVKIVLDKEEIYIATNALQTYLPDQFQILSNYVKEIYPQLIITNIHSGTTNIYEVTNEWFEACLAIASPTPTNFSGVIAALPIIPLEDSPDWDFIFNNHTELSLNNIPLTDRSSFDSEYWDVHPNFMLIELKDQIEAPVLGADYLLTAQINNPLSIPVNRTTVCWSFDSEIMEVKNVELLNGFSGDIWINNNNDSFGYLCGDLSSTDYIVSSNIPIMNITICPKVADILEMEPDEDVMDDDSELGMGAFTVNNINLLDLLYGADNPYWERVVVFRTVPQLQFDDLEIDKNSFYIIEDLLESGEGMVNSDEYAIKRFLWWAEGNENVDIVFNSMLNTARITPKLNWTGEEIFRVYCKDSDNQIGSTLVRVVVEDTAFDLDVNVEREEYVAAASMEFQEIEFNVNNSTTNKVDVSAFIIGSNGLTNYVDIQNIETGEIISSPDNITHGRLIWQAPDEPGLFSGKVIVRNPDYPSQVAADTFYLELVKATVDSDGDRYTVLVKNGFYEINGRSVDIKSNSDNASVKIKIFRNKNGGDGRVTLDSIKCNKGLRKISHIGDIKLIETGGPIGSIKVKNGIVGQIIANQGGVKSVKISATWDKEGEEFFEVGLLDGISAQGNIGLVKVIGGDIGEDIEPPTIFSAKGSIGKVITKMVKKTYYDGAPVPDNQWIEIGGWEGANIYASIYAPNGDIGLVKAIGGSVGIPDADEYDFAKIECKGNIKTISAIAKKGDGEVLGGYVHSDIICNGNIGTISAVGGDIIHETELEPDEVTDDIIYNTIYISATSVNKIEAKCKVYLFKDGEINPEWWCWEAHGGNMIIDVRPPLNPVPLKQEIAIGTISALGGTLCSYVEAMGSIKQIQTKRIFFHEDLDTGNVPRGGNFESSCIKPNIKDKDLNDPEFFSYGGFLNSLSIQGIIKNTKIYSKGPFALHKIKYGALEDDSEIWVDGQKVLSSN